MDQRVVPTALRDAATRILNALSLGANLAAAVCFAFYLRILGSTPSGLEWPESEGPAMLSALGGSLASLFLAVAVLLGVGCMLMSRGRAVSWWSSGGVSLIVSAILGAGLGVTLLYINAVG